MKKNKKTPSHQVQISETVETVLQEFSTAKRTFGATTSNRGVIDFLSDVVRNNKSLTVEQLREALGLCSSGDAHWDKDCEKFVHANQPLATEQP